MSSSKEHLDQLEETVNRSIDAEVETLLRSYKELVSLANIVDKDKYRIAQEAFQAEARADTMVRSVQSLCLLSESLKLSLLLSKSPDPALDDEALALIKNTELEKAKCAHLLESLLGLDPFRAAQIVKQNDDAVMIATLPTNGTAKSSSPESKIEEQQEESDLEMEDVSAS